MTGAALWLRFRAEFRARWRAWLGLALLVGFASGVVMAFVAGGRRTDRAYPRFLRDERAADVAVVNYPEDGTAVFDFHEIARLPQVASATRVGFDYVVDVPGIAPLLPSGPSALSDVQVLHGRHARPERAGEVTVGFEAAKHLHVGVGDRLELIPSEYKPGGTAFATLTVTEQKRTRRLLTAVPGERLRVVGIVAAAGEFPPQHRDTPCCVHATPALLRAGAFSGRALLVRLRHGDADVDTFRHELERRSGGLPLQIVVQRDQTSDVQRSIHVQAVALWLLGGLTALTALLVVGQLLARLAATESAEYSALGALGMTREQLFVLGLARTAAIAGVGALIGSIVALGLSALFPIGVARMADPAHGLALDGTVLGVGIVAAVLGLEVLAALPSWRAAGAGARSEEPRWGTSRIADILSRRGARPPVVAGTRFALERGQGRTAVPVGTSFAAVVLGVATLVAALTFGASLDHLINTPRLYGLTWDFGVTDYSGTARVAKVLTPDLRARSGVVAFAVGIAGLPLYLNDHRFDVLAMTSRKGRVEPPILEGRAPHRAGEVAFGTETMRELGVSIGDTVALHPPGGSPQRMQVVGRAVFPAGSEALQLGRGALVTSEQAVGLFRLPRATDDFADVYLRTRPGTDEHRLIAQLARTACRGVTSPGCGLSPVHLGKPDDIVNFGRVQSMPLVLGGVLAVLATGALAHVLTSAVRQRRRQLAMLKTLGFTRRQVRGTVAVQATTFVGLSLIIAVPLGIVVGRLLWGLRADSLGIANEPRVPWPGIALVVAGSMVVANLIAVVPARAAARTRPALVLRSE